MKILHCMLWLFLASYLEYGDEERILDMDDLMKVRYRSPRRFITPYEDINPKYFYIKDNAVNNFPEENHKPITMDLDHSGLPLDIAEDHTEKKSANSKDDSTITKLEDLIMHPYWLTLPDQRLSSKTMETNIKELTDVERIRRLQETFKDNLSKTNRAKKFWGKVEDSEDVLKEKSNNVRNNYENNDFEYENHLVLKTLNDFYVRLFNSLVQVVPTLRFEDPFITNFENRPRSNFNNLTNNLDDLASSSTNYNRHRLGQYIDNKLQHLRKEPMLENSLPEILTLSRIFQNFPSLLSMNGPSDKDDKPFKINNASKPKFNEPNDEKIIKFPGSENNFLQYIPQIKYNFDVDKNATNIPTKNTSTTKMWYYSNYYTDPTPAIQNYQSSSATPLEDKLNEKNFTTPPTIQWPHPKLYNDNLKFYKKIPGLGNLFRNSDMSRRIEWENLDENGETVDNENKQELLTTKSNSIGGEKWFKSPLKNHFGYLFNKGNQYNKHNLKCDGKFSDMVKNVYDLANGKYSLNHNHQPSDDYWKKIIK